MFTLSVDNLIGIEHHKELAEKGERYDKSFIEGRKRGEHGPARQQGRLLKWHYPEIGERTTAKRNLPLFGDSGSGGGLRRRFYFFGQKVIERAVVAAKREGLIAEEEGAEGGVAGQRRSTDSDYVKALGLNMGGKIGIARY